MMVVVSHILSRLNEVASLELFSLNNCDVQNKKADLDEHPIRAVVQVGLFFNEPHGCAKMPFA